MQELPNSLRTEASTPLRTPPSLSYLHATLGCLTYPERMRTAPMFCSSARACALAAGTITQMCIDYSALSLKALLNGAVHIRIRLQGLACADRVPGAQVCLYTCGDLIASVPFFEDAEEGFTTSVVTLLRPAVYLPVSTSPSYLWPASLHTV